MKHEPAAGARGREQDERHDGIVPVELSLIVYIVFCPSPPLTRLMALAMLCWPNVKVLERE